VAKYTADVRYIASIWPGKLEPVTLYHGPSPDVHSRRATQYKLTPVTRTGRPCVIEVADAFENVFNPMAAGNSSADRQASKPVDSQETVDNLLRIWAGGIIGVPPGAAPGIIQIIGTVPQRAELDRMREQQTIFAEWGFQQGELHHRQNQWKEITQTMRDMAIWLEKDVLWANPAAASELVNCVACGELVKPQAAVCRHCGMRLKALPPEIEALNAGRRAPDRVPA
jgi:hypothetical protein